MTTPSNPGLATMIFSPPGRTTKKPMPLKDYLKKQGKKRISRWRKRYFLQTDETLYYFTSHNDIARGPTGFINLTMITEVKIVDENKGLFDLVTDGRTYRLQICEESELTLQQWIQGIKAWLEYFEFRKQLQARVEQELEKQGLTAKFVPAAPSTSNGTRSRSNSLASITPEDVEKLRVGKQLLEREMANQEAEIKELKARIELLQSELDTQEHYKANLIDQKREALKLAIIDMDRAIDDAKSKLVELDAELQRREKECNDIHLSVLELQEQVAILKAVEEADERDSIDMQKRYQAQLQAIESYRAQVDENRVQQLMERYPELHQAKELWLASAQQQFRNEQLMRIIQRFEAESQAELKEKTAHLEAIQKELEATEKACRALEDHFLQQEGISREEYDEMQDLKEKYFISLAIGIKLWGDATGAFKTREVDIAKLFKAAQQTQSDWRTWKEWIQNIMIDPSTVAPNIRLTSGEESRSSAPGVTKQNTSNEPTAQ